MPAITNILMSALHVRQQDVEGGLAPPPGVTPDFGSPDDSLWVINIVTQAICIPISTFLVGSRIYVRSRVTGRLSLNDYTCILGWVFALAYSVIALLMAQHGAGINQWEVPKQDVEPYMRLVYATMLNYGPCAFFIKTSILLFCAKVFAPYHHAVLTMRLAIALMAVYYLPVLFLKSFICRPVSLFWHPVENQSSSSTGSCFDQRALILADAVISVGSDLAILLLPIPLACGLMIPWGRKVKVAGVFSAGGVATVCSIVRLVDIVRNGENPNATYVFMRINLWGIAEVNIGLICACLPIMPSFFKHVLPAFFSSPPTYPSHSHSTSPSDPPSIQMENTHSTHRSNTHNHKYKSKSKLQLSTTDQDTDENVLIGPLDPRKEELARIESSVEALKGKGGKGGIHRGGGRSMSPEDQSVILKTVEVRQTVGDEDGTWFRLHGDR